MHVFITVERSDDEDRVDPSTLVRAVEGLPVLPPETMVYVSVSTREQAQTVRTPDSPLIAPDPAASSS